MATNTTNYGFKKPDESDFYDVADQNKNWDLADKILKNLDTPTFEDYTGSTAVPSATDAIDQIKSKGKLGALLANIKAAFKGACLIGHIVNNCVTDNAGLPLSAAQGKVLMDKYTQLYSDLPIIGKFINKKHKDIIKIGSVVNSRSVVCVFPRYNTFTTIKCIYSSLEISAGEDQFQLLAWDTGTQNESTSTSLEGFYIVMPILSK